MSVNKHTMSDKQWRKFSSHLTSVPRSGCLKFHEDYVQRYILFFERSTLANTDNCCETKTHRPSEDRADRFNVLRWPVNVNKSAEQQNKGPDENRPGNEVLRFREELLSRSRRDDLCHGYFELTRASQDFLEPPLGLFDVWHAHFNKISFDFDFLI